MLLEAFLSRLQTLGASADADRVDELHSFVTSNLLIALAVLVSYKQFGGKPIECLIPPKFPGPWEDYTEQYCWAEDTYFLPFDTAVPQSLAEREDSNISYYQWVPFFLLLQAAAFRLPQLFWQYTSGFSGIQLERIVRLTRSGGNVKPRDKEQNMATLQMHLSRALKFHRRVERRDSTRPLKGLAARVSRLFHLSYHSSFITSAYLLVKVLYLANAIVQLSALNYFLGTADGLYGFRAFWGLLQGVEWETSGLFPRVTLCDLQIRVMGNLQRYSVQCNLVSGGRASGPSGASSRASSGRPPDSSPASPSATSRSASWATSSATRSSATWSVVGELPGLLGPPPGRRVGDLRTLPPRHPLRPPDPRHGQPPALLGPVQPGQWWESFRAFWGLLQGVEWETSGLFPRVTLCDLQIRVMGNLQRYSVQCNLVINLFNEKIFVMLWFWYAMLVALSLASLVQWATLVTVPRLSRWFIARRLELSDYVFDPQAEAHYLERFTFDYLKRDGVFVLRMISEHSGIIIGAELVASLYKTFQELEAKKERMDKEDEEEDQRTMAAGKREARAFHKASLAVANGPSDSASARLLTSPNSAPIL